MHLQETPDQQALCQALRASFRSIVTDEVRAALVGAHETSPVRRELFRRMGRDRMLGLGRLVEYGGQGRPPTDQFIVFDEAVR